jgi:hypothetical protein
MFLECGPLQEPSDAAGQHTSEVERGCQLSQGAQISAVGLTNLSARSVPRFTCLKGTQTTVWSSPGPQEPYCEVQAAGKCAQLFPFLSSTSSLWSLSLPLLLIAFSLLSFLPVLSQPRIKATLGKRSCEPSLVNIYSLNQSHMQRPHRNTQPIVLLHFSAVR